MTITALIVLVAAVVSLALLAHTVRVVFRDTPGPRTAPPRSHVADSFAPHHHDLAA